MLIMKQSFFERDKALLTVMVQADNPDRIKELIDKLGTVKYCGMTNTEHPVPNLPVFKSVRLDKDV